MVEDDALYFIGMDQVITTGFTGSFLSSICLKLPSVLSASTIMDELLTGSRQRHMYCKSLVTRPVTANKKYRENRQHEFDLILPKKILTKVRMSVIHAISVRNDCTHFMLTHQFNIIAHLHLI